MIQYLQNNKQLFIILFIWMALGIVASPAAIIAVPVIVIFFINEAMILELFFGLLFILSLSDNYQSFGFARIVKPVYVILYAIPFFYHSKLFSPVNKLYKPFLIFFAIATLCIPFSLHMFVSIQKTLSYFLILFITSNYVSYLLRNHKKRFLLSLVYFGATMLTLGLILKVVSPGYVHMSGRYKGLFGNPNGLGVYLFLYYFIFTAIKYYYPKLFSKKNKILIYFLIFASLLLCSSRGSLTVIIIFTFVNALIKGKNKGLILLIGLIGFVVYVGIIQNIDVIVKAFGLEEYMRLKTLKTGSGRLIAFEFTWEQIQKKMYYGGGFNYTNDVFSLNKEMLHKMGHQGKAHNTLLTMWLDTGIFGLLAYIYGWAVNFIKAGKLSHFALPVAVAVAFGINIESWLAASLNPFTIMLVILVSLLSNKRFISGKL